MVFKVQTGSTDILGFIEAATAPVWDHISQLDDGIDGKWAHAYIVGFKCLDSSICDFSPVIPSTKVTKE